MKKKAILVVDEELKYHQIIQQALGNGFCYVFCQNAKEALAAYREELGQFDLVIAAYKLGKGMDGIRLLERIREENPDQPAIFMSGSGSMNLQAGSAGFPALKKRFKVSRLKSLVESVLKS